MSRVDAGSTVELVLLEAALHDDMRCEIQHMHTECSIEVTHRVVARCNHEAANMCAVAAERKLRRQAEGIVHSACRRPTRDCFDIRPI